MLREKKKKRKKYAMYLPRSWAWHISGRRFKWEMQRRFDESQGECEDANMDLGDMLGELKRWVTLI